MSQDNLEEILRQEQMKNRKLEQELAEVNQELHSTNSELLQLTLDLDEVVSSRTQKLIEKNQELLLEVKRRVDAENSAKEAQKFWKEIFEATGQMVVIIDKNYDIITGNRATVKTLGLPIKHIVGSKCYKVFQNNNAPELCLDNCPLRKVIEGGQYVTQQIETIINNKHYLVSCTPVLDDSNQLDKIIHVSTDISKIRQLESELHQAQKMESIGTLAGGIAHDFNNILSAILGYTDLVLHTLEDETPIQKDIQEIYNAGLRAKDLVNQILAFARQSNEQREPIQVGYIVKEVLKLIRSSIPTTIEIQQDIESCSFIEGNSTQIHQILMNLCTNAAHAMAERGGVLEITLKDIIIDSSVSRKGNNLRNKSYIMLTVSDTGAGIEPHIIDKICEPYFTTKNPGVGTGMGLSMVHGIVEAYSGEMVVESTLGKGSTFTIYLPIIDDSQSQKQNPQQQLHTGKERILFVDDELQIVKATSRLLRKLGYTVTTRENGFEALELFQAQPNDYDLVISDITMPKMTGDELAKRLIQIRPDIPIILCTGYSQKISQEDVVLFGTKELLYKPITKENLAATVRQVLDKKKNEIKA